MKTLTSLLIASLIGVGCGSSATSADDLSTTPPAPDLANTTSLDLATEADMAEGFDLSLPPPRPPSMIWLSSGGGSFTGPATSARVNLSLGGSCVFGRVAATGGASLSLGNLALNTD